MATSAFKSTTKRTPIGNDKSSSSAHRRSRSLSRFSRPIPPDDFSDDSTAPSRGRFVNMDRGSGVPDISLDDLAIQLLSLGDRGRSSFRSGDVSYGERVAGGSLRRGRSMSRQGSESKNNSKSYSRGCGGGKVNSDGSNSRRRRSVSVVRYQIGDSESDLEHSQNSRNHANSRRQSNVDSQVPLSNKPLASNHRPGLRRSLSQKDLKYHDGYSSHSSSLTDDEGRDSCSNKNGFERTIRTVYAQKKAEHPTGDDMNSGLYEAMRKELRHAVEEIRTELEQSMEKTNIDSLKSGKSDGFQGGSTIRRNHATKSDQSEKCKQDLLAKLLLEKQHGRDISKIVKELLADPKNTVSEKPSRARKRSNDRSRMSERLTEEAEKYFEDFISNVEDTDISSLDGERSDTSSTLGGIAKTETFQRPVISKSQPVEMDGVVLPWLQWETSNDSSPLSLKDKELTSNPKSNLWDVAQEATHAQELIMHPISSHGSCSPGLTDVHSTNIRELKGSKFGELESYRRRISFRVTRSQFDVDEYLKRPSDEDFLLESWKQQQRIHSGGLLLCNRMFF
ncbi:hypothetical protein POTOM_049541 [Populus tomentosa]|uniref:Uncharacterized protein n=1 Tax=Populus tomentosa TaxID=118781 RepID=A0A8X7YL39_POPTO|nr:hypothetical protein POTOM_049541 [Populus tomentosa]